MNAAFKFVMALLVTILSMLTFRALVFTVYTVRGAALEPSFVDGDRVLVNRWSYGLRTGGGGIFRYARWAAAPVEHGDLAVFNGPAAYPKHSPYRLAGYCTAVPGDTVTIGRVTTVVPGKKAAVNVTENNAGLLGYIYTEFEGRNAAVRNGKLYVDGKETRCAVFANDYYMFSPTRPDSWRTTAYLGLVPECNVIGRVTMLLYSADPTRPILESLRPGRKLVKVKK